MNELNELSDKELYDEINEFSPKLAREVMRRLNKPTAVDMEKERYIEKLNKRIEQLSDRNLGD